MTRSLPMLTLAVLLLAFVPAVAQETRFFKGEVSLDDWRAALAPETVKVKKRKIELGGGATPAAHVPDAAPAASERPHAIAVPIEFALDSAEVRPQWHSTLDNLLQLMREKSSMIVLIEGHTDNTGTPEHNRALSQRRADAVKAYLIAKGIDGARLRTVGKGQSQPIGGDPANPANRRVEFKVG